MSRAYVRDRATGPAVVVERDGSLPTVTASGPVRHRRSLRRLTRVVAPVLAAACWWAPGAAAAPEIGLSDGPFRDAEPVAATAADLGVTTMRVLVDWSTVEPRQGSFDFSVYDRFFAALEARRIRPLLLVENTPSWAQDPWDGCLDRRCPPAHRHLDAWRRFVEAVVRRYGTGARDVRPTGVEVWNEPNITTNWTALGGPNVERYARILEFAAAGSRAALPALPVVLGGLSPRAHTTHDGITMERYVDDLYGLGAAGWFDALGLHAYPHPEPGVDPGPSIARARAAVGRLRAVRDRHRDEGVPIHITETGIADPEEVAPGVARGEVLGRLLDALAAEPDVRSIYVFRLRNPSGRLPGWGLSNPDLSPRSGYAELRARLTPAPAARKKRKTQRRPKPGERWASKETTGNRRHVPASLRRAG